jgi:hypothetical protein
LATKKLSLGAVFYAAPRVAQVSTENYGPRPEKFPGADGSLDDEAAAPAHMPTTGTGDSRTSSYHQA